MSSSKGHPKKSEILVVEDEFEIRELICLHIKREGYSVRAAANANEALDIMTTLTPDIICLDWMLPGLSGIEMLQVLKNREQDQEISILMITAKASPADIVIGLEAGADDYLTKPFQPKVLIARIKALLRRGKSPIAKNPETIVWGPVKINIHSHELCVENQIISLTPFEFKVLCSLISNAGKVLTRERLLHEIQDDGISVIKRTIDTHIFGIRKKLGIHGDVIETIRGIGYRITPQW